MDNPEDLAKKGLRRIQNEGSAPDVNRLRPILGARGPFRPGEHAQIRLTGAPGSALHTNELAIPYGE